MIYKFIMQLKHHVLDLFSFHLQTAPGRNLQNFVQQRPTTVDKFFVERFCLNVVTRSRSKRPSSHSSPISARLLPQKASCSARIQDLVVTLNVKERKKERRKEKRRNERSKERTEERSKQTNNEKQNQKLKPQQ